VFLDRIFFESHFSFFQLFFRLLTYIARAIFLHSPENENFENANLTKSFFKNLFVIFFKYLMQFDVNKKIF
jgi:hypothetical protein